MLPYFLSGAKVSVTWGKLVAKGFCGVTIKGFLVPGSLGIRKEFALRVPEVMKGLGKLDLKGLGLLLLRGLGGAKKGLAL